MTFVNQPSEPEHGIFAAGRAPLATAVVLTTALIAFEGLSVSAALPEIGSDLGSVEQLPWAMTIYLLASGLALALAGSLIDRLGVRIVFRVATLAFVASSALCATAPSLGLLIGSRLAQGLAGGSIFAASGSAVGLAFPAAMRSRVYALTATVWGVLAVSGPAIAAALLAWLGWRSIFWAAVPLGLIAALLGWRTLPGRRSADGSLGIDPRGALLVAGFSTAGLLALAADVSERALWSVAALSLAVLYWRHSGRTAEPILGRRYFAEQPFRALALTAGLVMAAGVGVETFLPLYLRAAREASITLAAWSVLFVALGWTVAANVAGRIYHRLPEARVAQAGAVLMVPTLLLLAIAISTSAPVALLFALYFVAGLGIGSATNACLTLVQQRAEAREIGRATAAHQFLRNLAVTLGTAAAGAIAVALGAQAGSDGAAAPSAATLDPGGLALGFAVAHVVAALMAVGAVLAIGGLVRLPSVDVEDQDAGVEGAVLDADPA